MIFVTVGTQLPFNRLLKCVDEHFSNYPTLNVVAQTGTSDYKPKHMKCYQDLSIQEFDDLFNQASVVIGHAGMGTILTSLCASKPVCIMPRLVSFDEHRNDHQVGTANRFSQYKGCFVFTSADDFPKAFSEAQSCNFSSSINQYAPDATILGYKALIDEIMEH